jgi:tRNA-specific 2-thiouridylase
MPLETSSVVVALSGGTDSAYALARLKAEGWDVYGLHLLLPAPATASRERMDAARRVADRLRVPLEIKDLKDPFRQKVVEPFIDDYLRGLTPNPCVRCNAGFKFASLLEYAEQRSISCVATGHYARIRESPGRAGVGLWRGADPGKDQSYFLHRLDQRHLARSLLPLGALTKAEVRRRAAEFGLAPLTVPESQEVCFIPEADYRPFIERERGPHSAREGCIVDEAGRVLGRHGGTYRYTIGQRQGLGISSSRPFYVKEVRPAAGEVVVARREALYTGSVEADGFHWIEGRPADEAFRAKAQVRYRHRAASGRVEQVSGDRVRFVFDAPQWAVTPGQALVCYDGDRVLGGGWIRKA